MKYYVQQGNTVTVVTPSGGLTSGDGCLIGSMFGVAELTTLAGQENELNLTGVVELPKVSALQIDVGDRVYWDNTAKLVNKTASGNTLIGVAITQAGSASTVSAANPSPTVKVRLSAAF